MNLSHNIILMLMVLIALPCRSMEKEKPKSTVKNQLENFAEFYILGSSSRETSADVPTSLSSEKIDIGLIGAVGRRDLTSVQLYLENRANPNAYVISISNDGNIGQAKFPFHIAAAAGFTEIADLLLKYGADIAVSTSCNMQALHLAAIGGHADMIQLLIDRGADVNARAEHGTPIYFALEEFEGAKSVAESVTVEIVQKLIQGGADVSIEDYLGRQPIIIAILKGLADVVEVLAANGANLNALSSMGLSPLHYAIASHLNENIKAKIISCLLSHDANVHLADKDSQQPIHYAAYGASRKIVELLLENGANINAATNSGSRPIDLAQQNKKYAVTGFIRQKIASNTQPIRSNTNTQTKNLSTPSKPKEAEKKIESGEKEEPSFSPELLSKKLYEAIKGNDIESVNLLLQQEVKINVTVTDESTAQEYAYMDVAAICGNVEIGRLLVSRGANVNGRNAINVFTPIHYAAMHGHAKFIEWLISEGVDVCPPKPVNMHLVGLYNIWSVTGIPEVNEGVQPIHMAAFAGKLEVVKLLVQKGVDIAIPDKVGNQPIHWSMINRHTALADWLISNGVKVDAKNKKGKTAVDIAKWSAKRYKDQTISEWVSKHDSWFNKLMHF